MTIDTSPAQNDSVLPLIPVQSGCCGGASSCGCEAGKPAATVLNAQGDTVSACCGKPVSTDGQSGACCG